MHSADGAGVAATCAIEAGMTVSICAGTWAPLPRPWQSRIVADLFATGCRPRAQVLVSTGQSGRARRQAAVLDAVVRHCLFIEPRGGSVAAVSTRYFHRHAAMLLSPPSSGSIRDFSPILISPCYVARETEILAVVGHSSGSEKLAVVVEPDLI